MTSDLRELIPRDKHDHERADAVVETGYPTVGPILWELLEWIQDMNWPIAKTLAPFLTSIGQPLLPHIQRVFRTDDEVWKYWIIHEILWNSSELAEGFRDEITRIAYSPTETEIVEELSEPALSLLTHYGWQRQM